LNAQWLEGLCPSGVSRQHLTVNQRVLGSSPRGGATLDKPSEMMAFSLSVSELG